jgi:hypothetical protein
VSLTQDGEYPHGHFSKPPRRQQELKWQDGEHDHPAHQPSTFWRHEPSTDLFVQEQRQTKLGGFIANLAAMDELIDLVAIAARVDAACPRPDRGKGGRPPCATEIMVRLLFVQSPYNLGDED